MVHWLGLAEEKVQRNLKPLFAAELKAVFTRGDPGDPIRRIIVHDCLAGYNEDQAHKIILAVETQSGHAYHTHIVKLGCRESVAPDFEGWRRCAAGRCIASRIFVQVTGQALPNGRAAAVYQDAFLLYGLDPRTQGPEFLEDVVGRTINEDEPKSVPWSVPCGRFMAISIAGFTGPPSRTRLRRRSFT